MFTNYERLVFSDREIFKKAVRLLDRNLIDNEILDDHKVMVNGEDIDDISELFDKNEIKFDIV